MSGSSNRGRVVIAGGSGFLGSSLANYLLDHGWSVDVLARHPPRSNVRWKHTNWDGRSIGPWCQILDGASAVVNLVGSSVDCIKSPDHQDEILRSRVEATRILGHAMRAINNPPPVWVQMSTAHIYGDPPNVRCNEDSPFGYGFAPFIGQAWEHEFARSVLATQRQVIFRTSFVIGRDRGAGGGALARLLWLVRKGLGGTVGSGTQGMSWIHEFDMNCLFESALTQESMQGAYIASAPNPISQKEFMQTLRHAVGMPIGLPAFSWMVRIGAPLFLRTDPELALYGRYVISKRLNDQGFKFQFSDLKDALQDLVR